MMGAVSLMPAGLAADQVEFAFTQNDLDVISDIVKREAGISLSGEKASLVYSRLAKRVRKLGLSGFKEYCALVENAQSEVERRELVAALTTNVTRFFREPHHFAHMREKIMPALIKRAKAGQRIRLWSAACSSGQEAYSMALTLLRDMPDAAHYDIKILATDIDPNVLSVAAAGIYDVSALEPVPDSLRKIWFKPRGDGTGMFQARDELRQLITFRRLNLVGAWPMKGVFQIIFCRNVVIYFDNVTQENIWSRFAPAMEEHGMLYIGHSERISGAPARHFVSDGVTIYRRLTQGGSR